VNELFSRNERRYGSPPNKSESELPEPDSG
jgi:hypothetical protein